MKLSRLIVVGSAIFCIALSGCAYKRPVPNAKVNFEVPSKLSIIKKDSLLRIIPTKSGRKETPGFAEDLEARLNKAGYFKVGNNDNPRYVLNLDTFWADRCDNAKDADYNIRFSKESITYKDGSGYEYMTSSYGTSYTASLVGAVSIYEVKNMNPLAYFNVAAEDTQWVWAPNARAAKVNCNTKGAQAKLMTEIIDSINGLLSKERRDVPVIIPSGGDAEAKNLLMNKNVKQAHARLETLLPPAELTELCPALYDKWDKEAEEAQTPKRDMAEDLCNYYLLFMAKEARGISEQSAVAIHDGYTRILLLANDKSLIEAAADSMARLEETSKRLGIKL
ncbi:hypothetical protein [Maridesulfovibrio sp. FT414]|uniref:hypothetical protein n=1 Tax=Maridesulfovibrio sp. FT414 TaxID=2979469 RepID=UPI003D80277E